MQVRVEVGDGGGEQGDQDDLQGCGMAKSKLHSSPDTRTSVDLYIWGLTIREYTIQGEENDKLFDRFTL